MLSSGTQGAALTPGESSDSDSRHGIDSTDAQVSSKTSRSGDAKTGNRRKAKAKSDDKQRRMSFLFGADTLDRLEEVKDMTAAASYSEIIRNALLLYEDYVKSPGEGYEYYKRRIDLDNRPVVLPLAGSR